MSITPTYVHVEMSDGTQHTARILLADRMALERTAKIRKWDMEADAITVNTFSAWAAMKRMGLYTDTYEAFSGGDCIDLFVTNDKPTDEPADDDPLNPTEQATPNA